MDTGHDYLVQLTIRLLDDGRICSQAAMAAGQWLDAVRDDRANQAAPAYAAALKKCLWPIEDAIAFYKSPAAAACGDQEAQHKADYEEARRRQGAAYCSCTACSTAQAIIREIEAAGIKSN
jgi:hypothetical protein